MCPPLPLTLPLPLPLTLPLPLPLKVVATALLTGQLGSTAPNGSANEMVSVGEDGTLRCFDCATRAMLAATELVRGRVRVRATSPWP